VRKSKGALDGKPLAGARALLDLENFAARSPLVALTDFTLFFCLAQIDPLSAFAIRYCSIIIPTFCTLEAPASIS